MKHRQCTCGALDGERGQHGRSGCWYPKNCVSRNHPDVGWEKLGYPPKNYTARVRYTNNGESLCQVCAGKLDSSRPLQSREEEIKSEVVRLSGRGGL